MEKRIEDKDDSEKLELASFQNQVIYVSLQDKLGKQSFHEVIKNLFGPVTDTI